MRIRTLDAIGVRLPMTRPMVMAGVEVRSADNLLVRISMESGAEGWGEAASAPTMTGETVEGMRAAVRYLATFVEGMSADDFQAFDRELAWRMHGNHAAKSAIEMALLDAVARERGQPVRELLGPALRTQVPVLWLIGTGDEVRDVEEATAKKAEGFIAYKIKIGVGDPADDAHRTLAICEALGPGMLISADANQGYDVEGAVSYVRAVEHSGLNFLEQPVAAEDLDGMASVAAASRIAIGADEGIHTLRDLQLHHDLGAARGASLKTIKLGGVRAVHRAALMCHRLDMRVNLACKIAESSLASAALLHLAGVLPTLEWGVSLTCQYLGQDLVHEPVVVAQGIAQIPSGHGLGVEVDPMRVREYQL